ncbi:MAG: hypothetical protein EAZ51_07025 [Sphingobacteriales bacterium]|nr:MAG: hypothetical protein EAZ64_05875 [Sphingobacteriales bacterium]TAF79913.1 MAG: hypothetical protein EAZ51_07025 [Sphingobacteriales bacterium]
MEIKFLLDILKYTLSGLLVIIGAYFILRNQFNFNHNLALGTKQATPISKDVIALKLQAYERLTLFIERINPTSLILRLHQPGMYALHLQGLLLSEIRAEYQHNITQQLYVNNDTWLLIKRVKDDTIAIINVACSQLTETSSSVDLSKMVFARLAALDDSPYDLALSVIKKEMEEM